MNIQSCSLLLLSFRPNSYKTTYQQICVRKISSIWNNFRLCSTRLIPESRNFTQLCVFICINMKIFLIFSKLFPKFKAYSLVYIKNCSSIKFRININLVPWYAWPGANKIRYTHNMNTASIRIFLHSVQSLYTECPRRKCANRRRW